MLGVKALRLAVSWMLPEGDRFVAQKHNSSHFPTICCSITAAWLRSRGGTGLLSAGAGVRIQNALHSKNRGP